MCSVQEPRANLRKRARLLADNVFATRASEIDRIESYPYENVEALKEAGLLGMTLPSHLGGGGLQIADAVAVIEEIAAGCGVTGRIVVETNLGAISAVMAYGTPSQQQLASKLLLEGDKPAICITEPEAGSAASTMRTRADQVGDTYRLNGKKHWITGGGVSRLHLIFARVFDEDGVEQGIGGFLAVRGEDTGLNVGAREPTMGLRGIPETEILLENLVLPSSRLLLPPGGLKSGFKQLMNAYNTQRVGAAAVALGIAKGAFRKARSYLLERQQFGRPIAEFQGLQWMVADMKTRLKAASLLIENAANVEPGNLFPDPVAAAEAKLFASETAVAVTNDALQMHGAMGYSRNCPIERMVRDARMFTIGGGTAQMLRNLIAADTLNMRLPQTRDGYLDADRFVQQPCNGSHPHVPSRVPSNGQMAALPA